ncbi:MAG TPA: ABC transporter permease subunit [Tissierellaceae bacterium]
MGEIKTSSVLLINVESKKNDMLKKVKRHWQLYFVILLPLVYIIVFHYIPMYGVQIAFKNYVPTKGIFGSPWVGFKHFETFFKSYQFWRLIKNTVGISFYSLIAGFPVPIILALSLNAVRNQKFKKVVQMTTYAPHFISTVVMVSIIMQLLSPRTGLVNKLLGLVGIGPIDFMGEAKYFKSIYVWSGIWQSMGFNSIIYIAALASIDPSLHEAAIVDGASQLQRIWYIDIPGIMPTATIMLILSMGQIMNVGFEKIYLMQNPLNMSTSDVISTYVYRLGLVNAQYSFSAAVGLFNSVVNLILLVSVNQFARKFGETSLW